MSRLSLLNDERVFDVQPLTEDAARSLGHVAWINETEPAAAIAAMFQAVTVSPVNCAVWIDSRPEALAMRKAVVAWRKDSNAEISSGPSRLRTNYLLKTSDSALTELTAKFAEKGQPGLRLVERHMTGRLTDIFAAGTVKGCTFQFRAGPQDMTNRYIAGHVDVNQNGRPKRRLLESAGSAGTYLFANRDAVASPCFGTDPFGGEAYWSLPEEGLIPTWEVPADAIVLLTDAAHPWQPALHSPPAANEPQKRAVMVYDAFV